MIYLLDANAFMEAARLYYGFDLVPAFWSWIKESSGNGYLRSVTAVRREILAGEGDLVDWATRLPGAFWFDDSAESLQHMTDLVRWAREDGRPYTDAAVEEFLRSADLRLIALAKAIGAAVATREVAAPRSTKKVKIPDACQAIGVTCVTPFQAYRAAGMCLS